MMSVQPRLGFRHGWAAITLRLVRVLAGIAWLGFASSLQEHQVLDKGGISRATGIGMPGS